MPYKVFISSTQRDIDVARDLARRIEEAGVRVFPVEDTVPGDGEAVSVTRSLREADEVIVILTDNSVNSPWVLYEMGAASGLHKRVTPLVVNVEDSEIPPFVKKYVRFAELPSYIAELAKRAGGLKPQPA
ncbi:MAG TPA: toll/interleukin-1 receptor domain-containing protein [Blastocatellia bacterium]|nr:toll/interleukin-1 receptor domain-containing protein [Blastocatellia bacterium]